MLYQLEHQPMQQALTNSAKMLRRKAPGTIEDSPQLLPGLELYFDAFMDLDSERSHSMGWMRIPYTAVMNYAEVWDFDEDQTERLIHHIRAMDSAHIERLESKRKKD